MENTYGIGVTNRYELFYIDDEATDPLEAFLNKKSQHHQQQHQQQQQQHQNQLHQNQQPHQQKQIKKSNVQQQSTTQTNNTTLVSNTTNSSVNNKNAEKENKSSALNKNQGGGSGAHDKTVKVNLDKQKNFKDNQNIRNQDGSGRNYREGKDRNGTGNERPQRTNDGETREQRNNRRNREDRPQYNQSQNNGTTNESSNNYRHSSGGNNVNNNSGTGGGEDRPRRTGGGGGGGGGSGGGGGGGGRRNFDGRGKREFDRQSGSDKTGIKAIDKRDGAGAHNWGTHKQDIEDINKGGHHHQQNQQDWEPGTDNKNDKDTNATDTINEQKDGNSDNVTGNNTNNAPIEEEAKELTLDEYKALKAVRAKPQYNLRKAGEGEDLSQWKKMIALETKKKEDGSDDLENDAAMYSQRAGRQKHILDIEFHFNDGRRGGGLGRGRGRARGGAGGRGMARNRRSDISDDNGPRGRGNDGGLASSGEGGIVGGNNSGVVGGGRDRRDRGGDRGGDHAGGNSSHHQRGDIGGHSNQNAPKVDDEHDFPSLG